MVKTSTAGQNKHLQERSRGPGLRDKKKSFLGRGTHESDPGSKQKKLRYSTFSLACTPICCNPVRGSIISAM